MRDYKKVDEKIFKTEECVKRYPDVILSYKDIPYQSALVFNAAVIKEKDKYTMVFRNDVGDYEKKKLFDSTNLGLAFSKDGIKWDVQDKPLWEINNEEIHRIYDPRLTVIDNKYYLCFAADTMHGVRGGIAVSEDLKSFEILSLSTPDNRNMVLFPEKINGKYVRLERPMPVYAFGYDKFDIWMSESPDMIHWGNSKIVLGTEDVPFCNDKIGPAAPPIKTEKGWLTIFHSVDVDLSRGKNGWENLWQKRYVVGIMLLDLNDPSKIIGMSKKPLMVPEGPLELEEGFRTNALFPCAMVREEDDTIRIYYSAGDAIVRMATAKLNDLLDLCAEKK